MMDDDVTVDNHFSKHPKDNLHCDTQLSGTLNLRRRALL